MTSLAVVAHLRSSVGTCSRPPSRTPLAALRLGARRSAPGVGRGRPRCGSPIVLAPPYYFQASAATCSRPPSCGPSAVHRPGKAAIHNPLFPDPTRSLATHPSSAFAAPRQDLASCLRLPPPCHWSAVAVGRTSHTTTT
jgi:hypothetical protein